MPGVPLAPLNSRTFKGQRGSGPVPPSAFRKDAIPPAGTGRARRASAQGRSSGRSSGRGRSSTGRVSPRSQQMPSPFAAGPGGPWATANGPPALANGPSLPQLPESGPAPSLPADELGFARLSFRDILQRGRHQDGRASGTAPAAAAITPPWEGQPDWAVCATPLPKCLQQVASQCWLNGDMKVFIQQTSMSRQAGLA